MNELISTAIAPANLLLTILLGVIVLYWLTVIIGALDMDSFDVDIDAHVHAGMDIHHDVHVDATHTHELPHGGFFFGILRFFNFGQVPFMVVLSILLLCMWSLSIYCNNPQSIINPSESVLWAMLLLVPNLVISLFLTKLLTAPLVPLFKKLDTHAAPIDYVGKMGTLTLPADDKNMGQARIEINHDVMLISVKSADGTPLAKGDKILIIEELSNDKIYIVQKVDNI